MINFKKAYISLMTIFISLIFVQCSAINLKTDTTINENGSGQAKLQIMYDNTVYSTLNKDIFDAEWIKENGFTFNKYLKDNMNVEEITCDFKSLNDLIDKLNATNLITFTYDTKLGFKEKTYNINFKFNTQLMDDLIKNNINTGNSEKDTQIYNYIKDVKLVNDITVPGTIINSNSVQKINQNTEEWTYKISQIDDNTNIAISYNLKNYTVPILVSIGFIALGLSGYLYYIKKIK